MKTTLIGAGNTGIALAEGLIQSKTYTKRTITLTKRNSKALAELQKVGCNTNTSNKVQTQVARLNEMQYQGLSSSMIKEIKLSANMANELYKES